MNVLGTPEEVRERHGVTCLIANTILALNEGDSEILVVMREGGITKSVTLTPDEARYLASKLRRLAWRVERRL
jgi:hypothetical protein